MATPLQKCRAESLPGMRDVLGLAVVAFQLVSQRNAF